jgi:integrase
MELVQPIKDINLIEQFKLELLKKGYKDYLLFDIAINIGLKITDILNLTVWDVKNKSSITIKDKKTNKCKSFLILPEVSDEINEFISGMATNELLFASRKGGNKPITIVSVYKFLNDVGHKLGMNEVGTHTLRKTFGYHHYKEHKDINFLQDLFSHSSPSTTLRYIGIEDNMDDKTVEDFFL